MSWSEIEEWSRDVADRVESYGPDLIIGLTRGGWVPARMLCDNLVEKNLCSIKTEHWGITATREMSARLVQELNVDVKGKKVLVVDDITDTGMSMELALNHILTRNPEKVNSATLLHIEGARVTPDYYSVFVPKKEWAWFIFPWNVNEDLSSLILKTLYEVKNINGIREALHNQFDIEVGVERISRVLDKLERGGRIKRDCEGPNRLFSSSAPCL